MKKILILLFLGLFFLFGCTSPNSVGNTSPDSRFMGEYKSTTRGALIPATGEYAWERYEVYTFSDSNKIYQYVEYKQNGIPDESYPRTYELEWKVENGIYYVLELDDNDGWEEFRIEYIDANTIKIYGEEFKKD